MPFVFIDMKVFGDVKGGNTQGSGWRIRRGGEIEMGMSWVWLPQKQVLRQGLTLSGLLVDKPRKQQ